MQRSCDTQLRYDTRHTHTWWHPLDDILQQYKPIWPHRHPDVVAKPTCNPPLPCTSLLRTHQSVSRRRWSCSPPLQLMNLPESSYVRQSDNEQGEAGGYVWPICSDQGRCGSSPSMMVMGWRDGDVPLPPCTELPCPTVKTHNQFQDGVIIILQLSGG